MSILPGAIALAAAAGTYGWLLEPARLQVTRHRLALAGLPGPLRLVHWSDLHGRDLTRLRWSGPAPDAVAFTGDLVSTAADLARAEATLRRLDEIWPSARGRFAVIGNHDRRPWRAAVVAALERAGYEVLDNRGLLWGGIWWAGTDDPHRGRPDLAAALAAAPADRPRVVLTHSPELFPRVIAAGVDLALAGHTHGGQVRLPGLGALLTASRLGRRYTMGAYREGRTLLYVSRGLGTVHLPVRLFCPPEVAVFDLSPVPLG